jgi:N-acetylated-alpha-linked acidic dipeptidase
VNQELMQIERNWCTEQGIPGRPWFKHTIYGTRSTYAHLELPGLAEAAEARDWKRAANQANILEAGLAKNSDVLRRAREWLDSSREAPKQ